MKLRIFSFVRVIVIVIVLVVSIADARAQTSVEQIPASAISHAGFFNNEIRLFDLINRERLKTGLRLLSWDDRLAKLARSYSRKMADEDFFDHIDQDGNDVVARAKSFRIRDWSRIGENLFECEGAEDPTRLSIYGWMHSPSHRRNLLDPDWIRTGIGIAETSDGRFLVTQVFIGK